MQWRTELPGGRVRLPAVRARPIQSGSVLFAVKYVTRAPRNIAKVATEVTVKIKIVVIDLEIPPRVKRWAIRVGIPAAVVAGLGAIAYASVPISFIAHGPLTAADLNADFNSLDGRVSLLETLVPNATHAVSADSAANATHAASADSATNAMTAATATSVAHDSVRIETTSCVQVDLGGGPATRCTCGANEVAISGGAYSGSPGNMLNDSLNLGGTGQVWEVSCVNPSGTRVTCSMPSAMCLRVQ
jgi:hypothetical protein